jgi:hypothetical protein
MDAEGRTPTVGALGDAWSSCREGWGEEIKINYLYPPHPNLIMPDCPVRHPAGKCKSAPGGFVPEGEGGMNLCRCLCFRRKPSLLYLTHYE